jgi:hypothetical protein
MVVILPLYFFMIVPVFRKRELGAIQQMADTLMNSDVGRRL